MRRDAAILLIFLLLLAGCRRDAEAPIPTAITSLDALATSQFMTQNAPPPGFRQPTAFPLIDDNLMALPNWRYELFLSFEGVFAGTSRPAAAQTQATVWFNDLGPERRIVIQGQGELFGQEEGIQLEAVRLGVNTFLLRNGVCLAEAGEQAALVADSRAGALLGGVNQAVTSGINGTINGARVWRYDFDIQDLNLPQFDFGAGGRITNAGGELWVAPEHNAVIRYYVNLDVENVIIRLSSAAQPLPVTGRVIIRYDLYDVGLNPNITRPFGC